MQIVLVIHRAVKQIKNDSFHLFTHSNLKKNLSFAHSFAQNDSVIPFIVLVNVPPLPL